MFVGDFPSGGAAAERRRSAGWLHPLDLSITQMSADVRGALGLIH